MSKRGSRVALSPVPLPNCNTGGPATQQASQPDSHPDSHPTSQTTRQPGGLEARQPASQTANLDEASRQPAFQGDETRWDETRWDETHWDETHWDETRWNEARLG